MKQKKTGPISDEGKARSSMNATKHGLSSQKICLSHEDAEEYQAHRESVCAAFPIKVPAQAFVVEGLVKDLWILQRNARLMAQMMDAERNKPITCLEIERQIGNIKMNGKSLFDIMKISEVYEKDQLVLNYEQCQRVIEGIRLWRLRYLNQVDQAGQVISLEKIMTYLSPDQCAMISRLGSQDLRSIDALLNGFEQDALRFMKENTKAGWIAGAIQAILAQRVMAIQVNPDYQRHIVRVERSRDKQYDRYQELNDEYINGLTDVASQSLINMEAQDVVSR
jgi:hypothetical protein